MIEITREGCSFRLSGHAGYAPPGQDIVCAAVSAVFLTLAGGVEGPLRHLFHLVKSDIDGDIKLIRGIAKGENRETAMAVFDAFALSFMSLAGEYPENIIYTEK